MSSTPITLSFSGILPTTDVEDILFERLQALEDDFDDLADWHASIETTERDDRVLFRVRIIATLETGDMIADHEGDQFWWTSLEAAVEDSLERITKLVGDRGREISNQRLADHPLDVPEVAAGMQAAKIRADITRRFQRLKRSFPGLRGFDIKLETVSKAESPAQRATIVLHVGGDSLISARTVFPASEDGFEVAARDAFLNVKRQAVNYAARRQSRAYVDLDTVA